MDRTLKALVRSDHAHAAYAEALEQERARRPMSPGNDMLALRAEVESSDADVTLLKREFLRRRVLSDRWESEKPSEVVNS